MTFDPTLVAKGLADRLADLEAARDRYASFAFTSGREASPGAGSADDTARAGRDLVLRALATLADPVNDRVVQRLVDGDATLGELAALVSLPHLVVWERVNDLIQVGLVRRALDGDRAGLTGAGRALAELVAEVAARVTEVRQG